MEKIIIRSNLKRVQAFGTGNQDASVCQIIPGTNHIPKDLWDKVKDHPTMKERMETEIVVEAKGKVPMIEVISKSSETKSGDDDSDDGDDDSVATSPMDLGAKEAKALVEETFNTPVLNEWLEMETRSTVVKAIEKQLEIIEEERKNSQE